MRPAEPPVRPPLAMRPEGLVGRLFGNLMERLNAAAYREAIALLGNEPDRAVLEVGFGTGRLVELLLARSPTVRVAGIDHAQTMLRVAQGRAAIRAAGDRIDLRHGDAAALPWPSESFDGCVALHCFQFWADPARCARELHRVLTPGGRLVLILRAHRPGRAQAWLPNPISRSDDEASRARQLFAAAGFAVDPDGAAHVIRARKRS